MLSKKFVMPYFINEGTKLSYTSATGLAKLSSTALLNLYILLLTSSNGSLADKLNDNKRKKVSDFFILN